MSLIKPESVSESPLAEGFSFPDGQTSDVREAMSPKDRVRKYRDKLLTEQRRRLEVWISTSLIERVSRIARGHDVPLWAAIQKALEVYVEEFRELAAESRCFREECTRLRGQADSPEWRRQAEEYNRKRALFNERLAKLLPPDRAS